MWSVYGSWLGTVKVPFAGKVTFALNVAIHPSQKPKLAILVPELMLPVDDVIKSRNANDE